MAEKVGRRKDLPRDRGQRQTEVLRAQHVPLPLGGGTARRPPARLHSLRHIRALQAPEGLQRAQPHGLRRLRPAGRAVRHTDWTAPGKDNKGKHSTVHRPTEQNRLLVRLGQKNKHVRPKVLPLDAVGVHQDVQLILRQRAAEGQADRGA